jgi:hypothetical protein
MFSILLTGCLIVPSSQTTTRRIGTENGIATFAKAREVTMSTQVSGTMLYVQAKRIGECTQPIIAISEISTTKHARLGGASDPRARAFGFLLAPITIPVSAIITGLAVASDTGHTERVSKPVATKRFACSLEANQLTVAVTMPSGAIVKQTTPRDGHLAIEIPDTEPYQGEITVSAPSAPSQKLAYTLPKPAVTAARDGILACSEQHHITGSVTAKLSINAEGQSTRVWLSAGDATFNVCVARAVSSLRFPEATRGSMLSMPLTVPVATAATL